MVNHVNPNKIDVLNQHLEPSNWNASSGETIGPKIEETTDDFGFLPIVLVQKSRDFGLEKQQNS